jgi:hypothetical protein
MQSSDFFSYIEKDRNILSHFAGIFSIDTIPKLIKHRQFIICNTDRHTGHGN